MTTVNIFTLNSYMFPPLISYFGSDIGKEHERVSLLAQSILEMEEAPDILAMQELWSNSIKNKLFAHIKTRYPHKFEDRHFHPFTLGSGLALYSRYPIERAKLFHFECWRGHHEFFAQKGFIIAKITANKKPLYIVTTHLQAGAGHDQYLSPYANLSTEEVRRRQLMQIKDDLIRFIQEDNPNGELNDYPVFIAGDLNMFPQEEEYTSLLKIFGAQCNLAQKNQKICGTSYKNDGSVKPKMIDHILSVGRKIEGSSAISDAIAYPISDHLAVVAKVKI